MGRPYLVSLVTVAFLMMSWILVMTEFGGDGWNARLKTVCQRKLLMGAMWVSQAVGELKADGGLSMGGDFWAG